MSDPCVPDGGRLRIDAHVHLIAVDEAKHACFVSESKKTGLAARYIRTMAGVGGRVSDEVFDIAYADHLAALVSRAKYLDKALVFAFDGLYDDRGRLDSRTETLVSNDWAIEVVNRHPDVFIFGASIHPARPDALDELDRCAEAGAVCVKWVPNSQGIDPGDRRYKSFYERMLEHGMVLTSHTGYEHSVFVTDQSLGDPERLRFPLELGLTVVAGHAGTSGFYHRIEYFPNLVRLIEEYGNLYADTSAIANPVRFPYLRRLLTPPVVDRLIQGTDYPVPPMPAFWPREIGFLRAVGIQATRNPFDRDYLGKVAAGFPEEHFYMGYDVFTGGR
ncbi:MAG: amidohydrolase family protein [Candidatus Geothermincolia bacterium]